MSRISSLHNPDKNFSTTMSLSDPIHTLPVADNARQPDTGDLEYLYNLFQPQNKEIIANTVSPFKSAFFASILFIVLSMPFVEGFVSKFTRNTIYTKLVLFVLFFVVYFFTDKLWFSSK